MSYRTIKDNMMRFMQNPVPNRILFSLLKNNKSIKTLKKVFTILLIVQLMPCMAQTAITGSINTSVTIPKVERNFTGFNSGIGNLESIYNMNGPSTGLEVNGAFYDAFAKMGSKICWRFPGGTTSCYYNRWGSGYGNSGFGQSFGEYLSFINVNPTLQNNLYGSYYNYSNTNPAFPYAKNNVIYPFINSITKNRTTSSNAVFCLNILNHYRSIMTIDSATQKIKVLYDTRSETLRDTNKIKAINNLSSGYLNAFNNSTLSPEFKKIVRQNIDAFLTMVNNNVSVYKVELGNESFGYQFSDNALVDYNSFIQNTGPYALYFPSDIKIWLRDDGTAQSIKDSYTSLWAYAHLARLYKVLMTDTLQKLAAANPGNATYTNHLANLKFGVPVTPILNSGFKKWDDFMRQSNVKSYMGIDAYVVHPYLDSSNYFKAYNFTPITNTSATDLTREFNDIRDSMEIAYNKRFFKTNHINLINALPSGSEVWYTEWNFNFDNSRLTKVGNTLLHAMFYYDAMMDFFDINANKNLQVSCNKINPLKLCNYQMPYAKSMTWYPSMRFTNGYYTASADPYTTTNSAAGSVEYNSTFYTHLLLLPVLNDDSMLYVNAVNGGFGATTNCTFRTFYKKTSNSTCSTDNVYIYFNNKSANAYKIDVNAALSISDAACVNATRSYLYANNLYASMGQTTFRTDDKLYTDTLNKAADVTIQRIFNQPVVAGTLNQVVIPKYSVGFVKVEITNPSATCNCSDNVKSSSASKRLVSPPKAEENISDLITPGVRLYPNPNTTGQLTIDITSPKESTSQITIFDIAGNLVKSFDKELSTGQNILQTDLSDLAKSIYIIRVKSDDMDFINKIVLQ